MVHKNNSINYIELPMVDKAKTETFYKNVFGWAFEDWGPGYISFTGANIDGGFNGDKTACVLAPGILIVLYADDLDKKLLEITIENGVITRPIYAFPGGKRFHFQDPNGNELAVWSDK